MNLGCRARAYPNFFYRASDFDDLRLFCIQQDSQLGRLVTSQLQAIPRLILDAKFLVKHVDFDAPADGDDSFADSGDTVQNPSSLRH